MNVFRFTRNSEKASSPPSETRNFHRFFIHCSGRYLWFARDASERCQINENQWPDQDQATTSSIIEMKPFCKFSPNAYNKKSMNLFVLVYLKRTHPHYWICVSVNRPNRDLSLCLPLSRSLFLHFHFRCRIKRHVFTRHVYRLELKSHSRVGVKWSLALQMVGLMCIRSIDHRNMEHSRYTDEFLKRERTLVKSRDWLNREREFLRLLLNYIFITSVCFYYFLLLLVSMWYENKIGIQDHREWEQRMLQTFRSEYSNSMTNCSCRKI